MFKRKIYDKLLDWKKMSDGNTALLIEGARRIGKSTVVEEFAKNEYESYILMDFSIAPQNVKDMFNDISDLNYFFLQLQLQYHVNLVERKSVIIFDEIQFCPKARQAIKFLVKDHRYDYIETGSLISIKKNVKDIQIPSEERKIEMHPMDYEEFLWALNDNATISLLKQFYVNHKSLGNDLNRELLKKIRLYMLVGGMPQAVNEYIKTNNFEKVDLIKRDILGLYEDDLKKIDSTGRLSLIFENIPAQLGKHSNGFKVKSVTKSIRMNQNTMLELIGDIKDSKIVNIAYHCDDPNVGLSANQDFEKFKIYLLDTGLFITLMFKDKQFTENTIYQKLLNDNLPVNQGFIFENLVAQILIANGNGLYYHTIKDVDNHRLFEIDFLLSRNNKIVPVEVKSSDYLNHRSFDVFCEKFSSRIGEKYIVHNKDYKKDKDIFCIPTYMSIFL